MGGADGTGAVLLAESRSTDGDLRESGERSVVQADHPADRNAGHSSDQPPHRPDAPAEGDGRRMEVVYAGEETPETFHKAIFLARAEPTLTRGALLATKGP